MTEPYPDRMSESDPRGEASEAADAVQTAGAAETSDRRTRPALVFDDPLTRPSRDDTDSGWGGGESHRDEAWYRRETPPHHGG
jgi:hypothetical protein